MALIDLEELKSVLGIGDIYPDAEVQGVADAAESIVLSFLTFNKAAIVAVKLESNVATFTTSAPHSFVEGSALTVTNCGSPFNGSRTVTARTDFTFKAAITNADIKEILLKPQGKAVLTSQAALYDTNENARTAALIIAEDIWLTRMGVTGQQGVDFQPAPYRLSRGLITRITGLLSGIMDMESLVG